MNMNSNPAHSSRTHLSGPVFFADFYIYPLVSAGFGALMIITAPGRRVFWVVSVLAGIGIWTFLEYLLHRYLLHHVRRIKERHEYHHGDQKALIGTPPWLSLGTFLVAVTLPAVLLGGLAFGSGFTAETMLGYLWYAVRHFGIHHWNARPGTYFFHLRQDHALHHHIDDTGNFGVTAGFWDHVFRTKIPDQRAPGNS
jgi:sterol desaturase/sphingolipid hydroxylase (fatty acid hydroxylase superfamily)